MLGHMVYSYLKTDKEYKVYSSVFNHLLTEDSFVLDVRKSTKLDTLLRKVRPDFVVNCVGVLIQESEENHQNAILLNSLLPHQLVSLCDKCGTRLIHISTDCVFSGKRGNYSENDFRDANDFYGRSKALGEIIGSSRHCTLRTSIIGPELYGRNNGLFEWFANKEGRIYGYVNAIWSGVTTLELAKSIKSAMTNDLSGLYHVTNGKKISKYELLKLLNEVFENGNKEIVPNYTYKVDKSLQKSLKFDFETPSYKSMLVELREWMLKPEYIQLI